MDTSEGSTYMRLWDREMDLAAERRAAHGALVKAYRLRHVIHPPENIGGHAYAIWMDAERDRKREMVQGAARHYREIAKVHAEAKRELDEYVAANA
ncbi:hypothetical protein [Brevibacterium sp. SMBL_HHYL_HB1]|uniref:hypothetical protein n=1 Tax=Brevibacterium sp. SMBL_HHYL_HB1 TaxID=2777556 RepID=UPI001BABA588|nr:hypothetical protein [Brevibacterium sp. SMBL_HHYL_HB1]QUL79941.1 hypothetical protein IG171_03615 [Brevibacterium sp. SMBL_HHYL_HB1]